MSETASPHTLGSDEKQQRLRSLTSLPLSRERDGVSALAQQIEGGTKSPPFLLTRETYAGVVLRARKPDQP
jgi:hypothetical protein